MTDVPGGDIAVLIHGRPTRQASYDWLNAAFSAVRIGGERQGPGPTDDALQRGPAAVHVVEIDDRFRPSVEEPSIRIHHVNDFLVEQDADVMDAAANRIADGWHRLEERDPSLWEGVSLGRVIVNEFAEFLIPHLQTILLAKRIHERLHPTKWIVGQGLGFKRESFLAAVQWDGVFARSGAACSGEEHGPAKAPIRAAPDRAAFTLLESPQPPVVAAEWATPPTAMPTLRSKLCGQAIAWRANLSDRFRLLAAHRSGRAVVVSFDDYFRNDGRYRELTSHPQFAHFPLYRQTAIGRAWRRVFSMPRLRHVFTERWRSAAPAIEKSGLFRFADVDLWPVVRPWLERQFLEAFPYLAAEARVMRRRLRTLKPAILLRPWVHRGRCPLAACVARAGRIPIGLIQTFWSPSDAYPTNHLSHFEVDHAFLWSRISNDWFRGSTTIRRHFVRYPDFDGDRAFRPPRPRASDCATAPHAGRPCAEESAPCAHDLGHAQAPGRVIPAIRRPVVLMTAQYWGPWTSIHSIWDTDALWPAFVAAARAIPEADFLGKIHPNMNAPEHEGPWGAQRIVDQLPPDPPKNFTLLPFRSRVREVLGSADLLVSYYSTTFTEAAMHGVPAVMLNLSGKRDFLPEALETGFALAARSADELITAIRRAIWDGPTRASMERGRRAFLGRAISGGGGLDEAVAGVVRGRCECPLCEGRRAADRQERIRGELRISLPSSALLAEQRL